MQSCGSSHAEDMKVLVFESCPHTRNAGQYVGIRDGLGGAKKIRYDTAQRQTWFSLEHRVVVELVDVFAENTTHVHHRYKTIVLVFQVNGHRLRETLLLRCKSHLRGWNEVSWDGPPVWPGGSD